MRSSQKSGRGRGKNNRNNNNNKNQSHSPNRVYESAGPEGKVRGTPQQIIDKYIALASDHQLSGDRVASENFLQHAEHYTRVLSEAQALQAERQAQQQNHHSNQNNNQHHNNNQNAGGGQGGGQQNNAQPGGNQSGAGQSDDKGARAPAPKPEMMDQPPADGLAAIDAAQDGAPDIVETPESRPSKPAASRPRRPRPKPKADAAPEAAETPSEAPATE